MYNSMYCMYVRYGVQRTITEYLKIASISKTLQKQATRYMVGRADLSSYILISSPDSFFYYYYTTHTTNNTAC